MSRKTLRIAVLSLHACPLGELGTRHHGGMSVFVREVCMELGRLGQRVDIYTGAVEANHDAVMRLGDRVRLIHLSPGDGDPPSPDAIFSRMDDYLQALERYRRREQAAYDLVHSHYWLSGLLGERASRAWGVPHLVMFHTLGAVKNRSSALPQEPAARLRAERHVARSSTRVLAATEEEKRFIARHAGVPAHRIGVVPCGVNLRRFVLSDRSVQRQRLELHPNGPVLLFVGRFDAVKGIDRLVSAMAELEHMKDLSLVLVGGDGPSSPETSRLMRLARELGVARRVRFEGTVPQKRLPAYYAAADVLVVPSLTESFGLAALEALACGTPVLSTRVGIMASLLGNGGSLGRIIPDTRPRGLAQSIKGFLEHLRARPPSPEELRDAVRPFGWRRVARTLMDEYLRSSQAGGKAPQPAAGKQKGERS